MRFLPVAALALLSLVAFAKDKHPDAKYQDAILVRFVTVTTGKSCSQNGTTSGKVDDDGNISANSSGTSDCANITRRHYTISVGQQTFVIEPEFTKGQKGAALATLGWSAAFAKQSVLADQLPGAHVLVCSDPDGFWVKVVKRESRYRVVAAQ
jgi:hypothetical protein